jgi:hypothetical protein
VDTFNRQAARHIELFGFAELRDVAGVKDQ